MDKKKEKKWTQVGNFEIGIEKSSNGTMLVCRSVAKNWSVRWRDDTIMFGLMLSIAREEGARDYLHSLITVMFAVTTYPHDLVAATNKGEMPFMSGILELIQKQNAYESSLKPQPTEEENEKSIEEMRRIAEMENEMAEMIKESEHDEDKVHKEGV